MAEAGATAVQEIAFTLSNAIAYVQAAVDAGLAVDAFAPRLAFFFVARTTLFEEAAKFRAARRIWADTMATRFGAGEPRSRMLRFHTQTAGVQLTAQPLNNVVRVAVQGLAAVLGGTQSLHTNAYDERPRPAQRGRGPAGPADPAGPGQRDRGHRHGRPPGRVVLRGAPDRRGRGGGPPAHGPGRGAGRRRGRDRARVPEGGDRARPTTSSAPSSAETRWSSGSTATTAARRSRSPSCSSTRRSPTPRPSPWSRSAPPATPTPSRPPWPTSATPPAAATTSCPMRDALRHLATVGEVCDALRAEFGTYRPPDTF